jgi:hypothetical protein
LKKVKKADFRGVTRGVFLHGCNSFRPDISGEQNMGVKTFRKQLVFDIGMGG